MKRPLLLHPFAVEAHFNTSFVVAYAFSPEVLFGKIPKALQLDLFEDRWAFVAAAFVDTRGLRPKGFPTWMGRDFVLAGYRIFVRYKDQSGRNLRGLYILKSETNRWSMKFLGNLFTAYNYSQSSIQMVSSEQEILVQGPSLRVRAEVPSEDGLVELPLKSPFRDWKEARRFAGPMPFTFTFDEKKSLMTIVQGDRTNWKPQPIKIKEIAIPAVKELIGEEGVLANAFLVQNIPYCWRAGVSEKVP